MTTLLDSCGEMASVVVAMGFQLPEGRGQSTEGSLCGPRPPAWLQRQRFQLFNWGTTARRQRQTGEFRRHSLFGDDVMTSSLNREARGPPE